MGKQPWLVIVLRLGHRPGRDKRVTSHVGLTARAFGAKGLWVAGQRDEQIAETLRRVCMHWGRRDFEVKTGVSWRACINGWKERGGEVIHLTMYGLHVDSVIEEIRSSPHDKLIVVGGPKVPREMFDLADYNVAIGHQPHSEVAALAVFLDRLFEGAALRFTPGDAELVIEPSAHGKLVRQRDAITRKKEGNKR